MKLLKSKSDGVILFVTADYKRYYWSFFILFTYLMKIRYYFDIQFHTFKNYEIDSKDKQICTTPN